MIMQWAELSALVNEAAVEQVTAIMDKFGPGGAVTEKWESESQEPNRFIVKIFLPNSRNLKKTESELIEQLSSLPFNIQMAKRLIKPEDWYESIKHHFGIQEIGERFIVKPSWIQDSLQEPTRIVLELDPGAAFGTGLHPTTRLCLLRLEKHIRPGFRIFDLGTGTGILSIAAARLGAREAVAVDIDSLSVAAAKNNVNTNGVSEMVRVARGTLSLARQREYKNSCDLVVANISVKVISRLAPRIAYILKPGGTAVCSGISTVGLDEVLISLALADLKIEGVDCDGEWYAVVVKKLKLR
jgi:ribosomal protein L11 methyltransferase